MIKTLQQNIDDFLNEVDNRSAGKFNDTNEGSTLDTFAGATAFLASEAQRIVLDQFAKTFFDSAGGPEETGGSDDLQILAVDHFGDDFERPQASESSGIVTFSRLTSAAGNVVITSGTIVKTRKNASGQEFTFETTQGVTLTGLTIDAPIQATIGGTAYNVTAGAISLVGTALTDPTITVTNSQAIGGGSDAYTTPQYRDFIRFKIMSSRQSVTASIEAAAKTVPGIVYATATERNMPVIEYDIATALQKVGAIYFRIPFAVLYVAGSAGGASNAQILLIKTAINNVRAYGVPIAVLGAQATSVSWTISVVLNSSGPNYAAFFSGDFTLIKDSMAEYMALLPIGDEFDKAAATTTLLNTWGPLGTNDVVSLSTSQPGASIAGVQGQKLIAGIMGVG